MKKKTLFNHFLGGILLVSGTTIGAGMLALPVSTAPFGFIPSIFVFLFIWLFMLATAFFFLDVNLSIKTESNLITMSGKTLGLWGKVVSWVIYLLLLYSLIAAYIAASAPIFISTFDALFGIQVPNWLGPFCLPILFGSFIYLGTGGVDGLNRALMLGLIVSFVLTIVLLPSHVEADLLMRQSWEHLYLAIPVVITSFGYHIVIPSLTTYMAHDRRHLVLTIVIGSILPLVVYLIWQLLVMGVVPFGGKFGLAAALKGGLSAATPLAHYVDSSLLKYGANFFSFFAIVTSFLGVSLSLSDFLIDGFKIKKTWEGRLMALLLVFIPPLIFVLYSQRGFIVALEYAGAFVAILLGFIPAAMAWTLKKYKKAGRKILLVFVCLISLAIAAISIYVTTTS